MNRGVLILVSAFVVLNLAFSVVAFEWNPVNWFKSATTTGNSIRVSTYCEAYGYYDCPSDCVKKCVPSYCNGGKCTNDCGPGSCTSKPAKESKQSGKKAKGSKKNK